MDALDRAINFTLARFLVTAGLLLALWFHYPVWWVVALLAVFITWDIADGHYARIRYVENETRRLTDGIVDHVSVHACLLVVLVRDYHWYWYLPFLIREIISIWLNLICQYRWGICLWPNWLNRLAMLSVAGAGVCLYARWPYALVVLSLAYLVLLVSLLDTAWGCTYSRNKTGTQVICRHYPFAPASRFRYSYRRRDS